LHPDVDYELALGPGQEPPAWLPAGVASHAVPRAGDRDVLRRVLREIDAAKPLPVDYVLGVQPSRALVKACSREGLRLIGL
jgi:hypothetical protein